MLLNLFSKHDANGFRFSLVNQDDKLIKIRVSEPQDAIYCDTSHRLGLVFIEV